MVLNSDVIVVGVVKNAASRAAVPEHPRVDTLYTVEVERFLRGRGPRTVQIVEPAGAADGIAFVEEGRPRLFAGNRYILFLGSSRESLSSADRWKYAFQIVDPLKLSC